MNYSDFLVTHNQLRDKSSLEFFIKRFESGQGFLNRGRGGISIITTEDNVSYLSDGHHEMTAAHICNVPIDTRVIKFEKYTYKEMMEVNFKLRYVTPYNPKTQVRKNNFNWFKEAVTNIYNGWTYQEKFEPDFPLICERWAREAIANGSSAYVEERKIDRIWEIVT